MKGFYRNVIWILLIISNLIFIIWYIANFTISVEALPYSLPHKLKITVSSGDTPYKIVDTLKKYDKNIDTQILLLLMQKYNVSRLLKADYVYCIPPSGTYFDIIISFQDWCDKAFTMVTFPEGITVKDMAYILYKKTNTPTISFIDAAKNPEFLNKISEFVGTHVSSAEGFLYPDTYAFNGNVENLVFRMFDNFKRKTSAINWQAAEKHLGLSKYQIIILASIVEKEAVKEEEAPIIAGVFINRLRRGMKLQSCPTVEYALGIHKPVLSEKDIQIDSPYNTYRYYGLPPTPIGNPSVDTILATIHYKPTDYLYFVADGKGGHLFAKTYAEHLANIRRVESGK